MTGVLFIIIFFYFIFFFFGGGGGGDDIKFDTNNTTNHSKSESKVKHGHDLRSKRSPRQTFQNSSNLSLHSHNIWPKTSKQSLARFV